MSDVDSVQDVPRRPGPLAGSAAMAGFPPPSRWSRTRADSGPEQRFGRQGAEHRVNETAAGSDPDRSDTARPNATEADAGGADAGGGDERGAGVAPVALGAESTPTSRPVVTVSGLGRLQSGRHREHVVPARPHRVAPSFTVDEYAVVVAAASRVGLTPTGFCARAALAIAIGPPGEDAAGPVGGAAPTGARTEALAAVQAELAALRVQVVRVGTNLNQALAAFHKTGEAPVWLEHVVELCGRALAAVDSAASGVHRRLR